MVKVQLILQSGRAITIEAFPRASSLHHSAGSERGTPRRADFLSSSHGTTPRSVQCRDVLELLLQTLKVPPPVSISHLDVIDADSGISVDLFRPMTEGQRLCVFCTQPLESNSTSLSPSESTEGLSKPKAPNCVLSLHCLWQLQRAHQELLARERDDANASCEEISHRFQQAKQRKGDLLSTLSRTKLPFKETMVLDELNTERLDGDVKNAETKLRAIVQDLSSAASSTDQTQVPFGTASWEDIAIPSGLGDLKP